LSFHIVIGINSELTEGKQNAPGILAGREYTSTVQGLDETFPANPFFPFFTQKPPIYYPLHKAVIPCFTVNGKLLCVNFLANQDFIVQKYLFTIWKMSRNGLNSRRTKIALCGHGRQAAARVTGRPGGNLLCHTRMCSLAYRLRVYGL
jgi:hypothetical protein